MSAEIADSVDSNMLPLELTLIVAATRNMGIGRAGTLPWTGLKKEMAYFARVTKRSPPTDSNSEPFKNAVIMGRKTWDSIPQRFRPLKGRMNAVISRSHVQPESWDIAKCDATAVQVPSLRSALDGASESGSISRLFVIGGAEIYKAALQEKEAKRILLTRVLTDFECDTFFPVKLGDNEDSEWKKRSKEELDQWVGETVPEGVQEENGIKYVFEMYERA